MLDPYHNRETMRYRHPIASRELIVDLLKKTKKALNFVDISKKTKTHKKGLEALQKRLSAMVRDGQLKLIGKKYALSDKASDTGHLAEVLRAKDGLAYVVQADETLLEIASADAPLVLPFDRVRYRSVRHAHQSYAHIISIETRRHNDVLGVVEKHGPYEYFVTFIKGLPRMRLVGDIKAEPLQVVRAEIWVQARLWHAKIVSTVGHCLDGEMPERIAEHVHFPYDQDNPAPSVTPAPEASTRLDWRDKALVTIDGPTARDFDDAVMAERGPDGSFLIYVAIADVAHYVPVSSPMDLHAYERATSVYFPKQCLPMLPEVLSNDLCSLKPHEDRHAMGVTMRINEAGDILDGSVARVLIRSKARLTYEAVEGMLKGTSDIPEWFQASLSSMKEITDILKRAAFNRRALWLPPRQEQLIFDEAGRWQEQQLQPAYDSHILIEKMMVLTNHFVAKFLQEHRAEAVYRHHPNARPEGIEALLRELKNANINTDSGDDLFSLNERIRSHKDYTWLAPWVIRAMSQARYEKDLSEHHGLSLDAYVHFTSPIRRYPDLMVHRSICGILEGQAARLSPQPTECAARRCSRLERRADTAVYDAFDLYQCQWVYQHLHETHRGSVSTLVSFGVFVKLDLSGVEVLLPASHLESLGYRFDGVEARWTHPHDAPLMMGHQVQIRLTQVSFPLRRRDAHLIEHIAASSDGSV